MFKSFILRNVSDIPKNMCAYNLVKCTECKISIQTLTT